MFIVMRNNCEVGKIYTDDKERAKELAIEIYGNEATIKEEEDE